MVFGLKLLARWSVEEFLVTKGSVILSIFGLVDIRWYQMRSPSLLKALKSYMLWELKCDVEDDSSCGHFLGYFGEKRCLMVCVRKRGIKREV